MKDIENATVDRHFARPSAKRAKDAAAGVAHSFAMRMGLLKPAGGQLP